MANRAAGAASRARRAALTTTARSARASRSGRVRSRWTHTGTSTGATPGNVGAPPRLVWRGERASVGPIAWPFPRCSARRTASSRPTATPARYCWRAWRCSNPAAGQGPGLEAAVLDLRGAVHSGSSLARTISSAPRAARGGRRAHRVAQFARASAPRRAGPRDGAVCSLPRRSARTTRSARRSRCTRARTRRRAQKCAEPSRHGSASDSFVPDLVDGIDFGRRRTPAVVPPGRVPRHDGRHRERGSADGGAAARRAAVRRWRAGVRGGRRAARRARRGRAASAREPWLEPGPTRLAPAIRSGRRCCWRSRAGSCST